jgi:hypothetical protein
MEASLKPAEKKPAEKEVTAAKSTKPAEKAAAKPAEKAAAKPAEKATAANTTKPVEKPKTQAVQTTAQAPKSDVSEVIENEQRSQNKYIESQNQKTKEALNKEASERNLKDTLTGTIKKQLIAEQPKPQKSDNLIEKEQNGQIKQNEKKNENKVSFA